jgi:hypothetical protein
MKKRIRRRGTEYEEFGQFFIKYSFLCALSVSAVEIPEFFLAASRNQIRAVATDL